MSLERLMGYVATNKADAIAQIKSTMISAGWILEDDQTASSYCIYSSSGEDENARTVYLEINWATVNYIKMYMYVYWNSSTHTGIAKMGSAQASYNLKTYDNLSFILWVYCDKNCISLITKIDNNTHTYISLSRFTPFWSNSGVLLSDVIAGDDITLTVSDIDGFDVDVEYQILGQNTEGRYNVSTTAVDEGASTITVSNLPVDFATGSIIGQITFPWALLVANDYCYLLSRNKSGIGQDTTSNLINVSMLSNSYTDPDQIANQKYTMWPIILYDVCGGTLGHMNYNLLSGFVKNTIIKNGEILGKDIITSGTANNGGLATLTDTDKSWIVDSLVGKGLIITSGVAAPNVRKIVSNTETEITVEIYFSENPNTTTKYSIYNEVWRYFHYKKRFNREI